MVRKGLPGSFLPVTARHALLQSLPCFLRLGEIAGAVMAFGQQTGPARRKVKVGTAAGPRYVFADMEVGQVRPFLADVMGLRS